MSAVPGRILLAAEDTVAALADAVDPRYRALVLLLRYTALRWGEAVALRRRRCFVAEGSIEVAEMGVETGGGIKFRALGPREYGWVSVRGDVRDALAEHLARFVGEARSSLVFTDESGRALMVGRFEREVWRPALRAVGLPVEDTGVDTLGTAQLWEAVHEATAQRAELRAGGLRGGGAGA